MLLFRCKVCKKEFSDKLTVCPYCGTAKKQRDEPSTRLKIDNINSFVSSLLSSKLSTVLTSHGMTRDYLLELTDNFDEFYSEVLFAVTVACCDEQSTPYREFLFARHRLSAESYEEACKRLGLSSPQDEEAFRQKAVKYLTKRQKLENILVLCAKRTLNLLDDDSSVAPTVSVPELKITNNLLYSTLPISLTVFLRRVMPNCNRKPLKKLTYKMVADKLFEEGYLEDTTVDGKSVRQPTEKGKSIGISEKNRLYRSGKKYTALVYTKEAQEIVVELLPEVFRLYNL